MDSKLLAGAYSKTYQALEQAQFDESERYDSLARAKKLSLETNKRRKLQAHKRRLEAQREERRRQVILARRREEQKLATEKYQRSHIPPTSRQGSGRLSPKRQGVVLDDALWLIRGNHHDRPKSAVTALPKNETEIAKERSHFENLWYNPVSGSSNRALHTLDRNIHTELMDSSLQNFTNSKTLFEQQLEHQQHLLLEQQQQSLREFNRAIQREIETDKTIQGITNDYDDNTITDNDEGSFSSMDSLDSFSDEKKTRSDLLPKQPCTRLVNQVYVKQDIESNNNAVDEQSQQKFFLHSSQDNSLDKKHVMGSSTFRVAQDMATSALPETKSPKNETSSLNSVEPTSIFQSHQPYSGPTAGDIIKNQGNVKPFQVNNQSVINESAKVIALKQYSTDSLDSVSTVSTISQKDSSQSKPSEIYKQSNHGSMVYGKSDERGILQGSNNAWISSGLEATSNNISSSRKDTLGNSFQPRYASAIGSTLMPGQGPPTSQFRASLGSTSNPTAPPVSPISYAANSNVNIISQQVEPTKQASINTFSTASTTGSANNYISNTTIPDFNKAIAHYPQAYFLHTQDDKQSVSSGLDQHPMFIPQSSIIPNNQSSSVEALKPHPPVAQMNVTISNEKPTATSQPPEPRVPQPPKNNFSKLDYQEATKVALLTDNSPTTRNGKINNMTTHLSGSNKTSVKNDDLEKFDLNSQGNAEYNFKDDVKVLDEVEDVKPVKGILKPSPVNTALNCDGHTSTAKQHPRDSLELARFQHDKKIKKKSVRFAENHIEETEYDHELSVSAMQKLNRPASAKVVSMSTKTEIVTKAPRASSAGSNWPTHDESAQLQIRNVQQMENISNFQNDNTRQSDASTVLINSRSNLPASFTMPLNTTTPVINRPKAAAHIIMSSESHHQNKSNGLDNVSLPHGAMSAATVAHKSNLDAKVKSINNNFMSKIPAKIIVPTNTNVMVYHAAYSGSDQNNNKTTPTNVGTVETSSQQVCQDTQYNDRSKIRDNTNRRVAISNQTVTRTSIVPTSSKITYPQQNSTTPSYSTNTGNNSAQAPVYDENGLRIDRTPTDEEITWLWDKVRSCLQRDDNANKTQNLSSANNEPSLKTPPAISTKLIDGASLGFGPGKNATVARNGSSGFFHPAPAVNSQAKSRPVMLQQGSYLKRFGLLKQRRTNSANGVGSTSTQVNQRANSAMYNRQPTIHPLQPTVSNGQPQQLDGPVPIALAYRPQEAVSESTAAFLMAERLAKQSLTDSHIQLAMEDAKSKQEAYNRSKFLATKGGGPSALSIEEQKLMESLDRLNEKLQVLDSGKNSGTIYYHQPFHTQLGFRSQTQILDSRYNVQPSPRSQQRAQSARIRQQTRQYR
ncbi:hypothetical protein Bpfe_025988 [Biomphalaria pfeifferi]|uniref:Uncharacterized protein n=1 Tax=Biomphalaria pfeifferi TaxID=112525 RepID=A0AAD8EZB4_BIOPF|nr:hypothetical protein Bpfe_025988 [Biomphalaria pfeifferi]